jgi:hypothetical protein
LFCISSASKKLGKDIEPKSYLFIGIPGICGITLRRTNLSCEREIGFIIFQLSNIPVPRFLEERD